MGMKHYEGKLGVFDYDDENFALRDAIPQYEVPFSRVPEYLRYIGKERNGENIHIPDGLKSMDYMFYNPNPNDLLGYCGTLVSKPFDLSKLKIPASVEHCEYTFENPHIVDVPVIPETVTYFKESQSWTELQSPVFEALEWNEAHRGEAHPNPIVFDYNKYVDLSIKVLNDAMPAQYDTSDYYDRVYYRGKGNPYYGHSGDVYMSANEASDYLSIYKRAYEKDVPMLKAGDANPKFWPEDIKDFLHLLDKRTLKESYSVERKFDIMDNYTTARQERIKKAETLMPDDQIGFGVDGISK